ncbi:MAG: winged helix-turn-helix domain-containing protein [Thermoproteota archaeon]|nr:winged helix-turn-helix domain-containing protein [Thermoproteota archaeon]
MEVTTKEYRGRQEIITMMLKTIIDSQDEGATKTSIMYKSFLSYAQLKEYLSFLLEKGLVEQIPKQTKDGNSSQKNVYKITGRGLRLLEISKEIEKLVGLD